MAKFGGALAGQRPGSHPLMTTLNFPRSAMFRFDNDLKANTGPQREQLGKKHLEIQAGSFGFREGLLDHILTRLPFFLRLFLIIPKGPPPFTAQNNQILDYTRIKTFS